MTEKLQLDSGMIEPQGTTTPTPNSAVSQAQRLVEQTFTPYAAHKESPHECTDACLPGSGDPDSLNPDTSGFDHLLIRSTRPTAE